MLFSEVLKFRNGLSHFFSVYLVISFVAGKVKERELCSLEEKFVFISNFSYTDCPKVGKWKLILNTSDGFIQRFFYHDSASPGRLFTQLCALISLSALDPVILIEPTFHSTSTLYVEENIISLTRLLSSLSIAYHNFIVRI